MTSNYLALGNDDHFKCQKLHFAFISLKIASNSFRKYKLADLEIFKQNLVSSSLVESPATSVPDMDRQWID